MSIATTDTVMTEADAERITEKIRVNAINARDALEKLQSLLTEARDGRAHVALGYASWTAYLADVMGEQPLRLPRDQRQEIVGYLAGEGMSSRAIAPIVGASQRTVSDDMQVSNSAHLTTDAEPEPDYVTDQADLDNLTDGVTGEEVATPGEATANADDPEGEPSPKAERSLTSPPPPVTGLDGKTYQRREPAKPKRRPLTDAFFDAKYDIARKVESLHRLTQDDRFPQNRQKVAEKHLNDLLRTRDLLEQVINSLKENNTHV